VTATPVIQQQVAGLTSGAGLCGLPR
jgi:hypothetical protein